MSLRLLILTLPASLANLPAPNTVTPDTLSRALNVG